MDESAAFCMLVHIRKPKSYSDSYWVEWVKYGCGLLVHGTLKSAISSERTDELS